MVCVAIYCRVSTDKNDQQNSFESQQNFFKEYVKRQDDWILYDVYADEGITGTSTRKRIEFNRMINDAKQGRFSLIITKEVSRFSRNILDTISFTRELKKYGVGVFFMNDGINTLEPDAELRLSIMGSIAQEESRKTSSRVKWGQSRQMEKGVVFGTSMLGYDVKKGRMTVNKNGAEIIRLIFYKYGVEKKGTTVIAEELQKTGYRTYHGNIKWSNSQIIKILKNEKYVGDLIQKKTFTPDYLTHLKKYNHGEEEKICIKNHHEAIIDRELWDLVQDEIKRRNYHRKGERGHSNSYLFSGKIKCGECGASFISRNKYRSDGSFYKRWACYNSIKRADLHEKCNIGRMLRDDLALEMVKQAHSLLQMDREWIINNLMEIIAKAIEIDENIKTDSEEKIKRDIKLITKKKENVLDAFFSKTISKEEMKLINNKYDEEIKELEDRIGNIRENKSVYSNMEDDIKEKLKILVYGESQGEAFYKNIIECITVYKNKRAELRFKLIPQRWIFVIDK